MLLSHRKEQTWMNLNFCSPTQEQTYSLCDFCEFLELPNILCGGRRMSTVVTVCTGGRGQGLRCKRHEGTFWVNGNVFTLIGVWVAQVYAFVKMQ